MASNDPNARYGSGGDPRGRIQNQVSHAQERYENQQGPMADAFAYNYGRGSEANYGDYTDIMNQYRNIAGGGGSDGGGGGGGGGGFNGMGMYTPFQASYKDPFKSYSGYEEFSNTGGYSPSDIANMRARGTSPIRSAYANAEREVGRQRSLQGGYSPNAIATRAKMAREQGQSAADATQNVEAGLAQARNQGRLAGLGGMSGIEGQRLGADVDISKFNAQMQAQAQAQNIQAGESAANRGAAASAQSNSDRMRALAGMTALYGTTPGMSELFGNQLIQAVGQGGEQGIGLTNSAIAGQQLPGQFDQTMNRIGQIGNTASNAAGAIYPWLNQNKTPGQTSGRGPTQDAYQNEYQYKPNNVRQY